MTQRVAGIDPPSAHFLLHTINCQYVLLQLIIPRQVCYLWSSIIISHGIKSRKSIPSSLAISPNRLIYDPNIFHLPIATIDLHWNGAIFFCHGQFQLFTEYFGLLELCFSIQNTKPLSYTSSRVVAVYSKSVLLTFLHDFRISVRNLVTRLPWLALSPMFQ